MRQYLIVLVAGIPRESGDDPQHKKALAIKAMYSPRERG